MTYRIYPSSSVWLRDVGTDAVLLQVNQNIVAMISLVCNHFLNRLWVQFFSCLLILGRSLQIGLCLKQCPRQRLR